MASFGESEGVLALSKAAAVVMSRMGTVLLNSLDRPRNQVEDKDAYSFVGS